MVPFNPGSAQNQAPIPDGTLSFEADLRKTPGMRLGIDVVLVSSPHGCGLVVERVNEGGLVEAWNRRSRDPMRIRSGDFIVRVNSIEGEISALASELRSGSDVRITVQRAARDTQNLHTWKDLQACIANKTPGQNPGSVGNSGQQSLFSEPPPELTGNASSGYPGPVGLPGQQNNPRPKAPGVTSWGGQAPGYQQHAGMPNFLRGADSQQQWQGNRWPGNQWAMSDAPEHVPESRLPPSRLAVGATEPANSEGMEAIPDNAFSFEVTLSKPERARLGIDVMPHTVSQVADFCGLTVKRVSKGGIVDEWNHACRDPRAQVCPGDRIVRVNGVTSDFAQMWEMLCTQRELKVTVRRCSNQLSSFSQGHQGFGVGPVQLPGRGAPMLENLRPALIDDSRGSGPQAGKSPPAISLPNQTNIFGRDGSQRVGQIAGNAGFGASGMGNSGNNAGYGFGKGGPGQEAQASAALHSNNPRLEPPMPQLGSSAAALTPAETIRFDVTLENSKSKRVGMDVIMVSGNQICGFVVERVMEGGRVDIWNKQSQPPYTVQTGDYIVQVNGVGNWQSLSKMAEEFVKEGRQVSFTIQRGPPAFENRMGRTPADAPGGKQAKRQEADTRSPPKAPGANFDAAADRKGGQSSEQARPEASPPMPMGLSKMSSQPQAPTQSSGLRQALSISALPEASSARIEEVIEETASSEAPVDMPAPFAAMTPKLVDEGLPAPLEPPPGLPLPSQDPSVNIAAIAAAPNMPPPPPPPPQELMPAMTSLTSGLPPPPMAPPPPPRQAEIAGESDSIADAKEDVRSGLSSRDDVGKAIPGRSIGAGIGRTSEEKVPLGLTAVEEALALENKEDEASKPTETPTALLASSLQLKDEDLTALLQLVLRRKPHLRVTVSKALSR